MTMYEAECKMIEDVLKHEGVKLNPEMITVQAILDSMYYWPEDYDIYQWIKDTKMNDPKCFM